MNIKYKSETKNGVMIVYEINNNIYLEVDGQNQGVWGSISGHPLSRYLYAMGIFFQDYLTNQKVLIIGGGAILLPRILERERKGESTFDIVDCDPRCFEVAQEYFGYAKPPNHNLIVADGFDYLSRQDHDYDVIFVDAFNGDKHDKRLYSREGAVLLRKSLSPDEQGRVVLNVVSDSELKKDHELRMEFLSQFDSCVSHVLHKGTHDRRNVVTCYNFA